MSFHRLLYHIVFSTKGRRAWIVEAIERDVYNIMYHLLLKQKCFVHRIGGMPDHVHLLVEVPPSVALSEVIKVIKQESSKEIRRRGLSTAWGGWEEGFGAFTNSRDDLETIKNYIINQKNHHRHVSFLDEYSDWLTKNGIDVDSPYFPKSKNESAAAAAVTAIKEGEVGC